MCSLVGQLGDWGGFAMCRVESKGRRNKTSPHLVDWVERELRRRVEMSGQSSAITKTALSKEKPCGRPTKSDGSGKEQKRNILKQWRARIF